MKNRDYKIFRQDQFYHVFNRGNNRGITFIDDQDYQSFLNRIRILLNISSAKSLGIRSRLTSLPANSFSIISYALMPNHYHFFIKQNAEIPIGLFVKKLMTSYAKYFNIRHDRVGNVFQDIFKAKHVDSDSYFTSLSAYIHNNPENPSIYPYSSFQEYLNPENSNNLCNTSYILNYFNGDAESYKQFVESYGYREYQNIKHLTLED